MSRPSQQKAGASTRSSAKLRSTAVKQTDLLSVLKASLRVLAFVEVLLVVLSKASVSIVGNVGQFERGRSSTSIFIRKVEDYDSATIMDVYLHVMGIKPFVSWKIRLYNIVLLCLQSNWGL